MTQLHRYAKSSSFQVIESGQKAPQAEHYLDHDGEISLLVWNIFKQKRPASLAVLKPYFNQNALVLLQESLSQEQMKILIDEHQKIADHVPAYAIKGIHSGVMTIAHIAPLQVFSFKVKEPLIRIPKSALITFYRLSNQQTLLVVNIHSINFSFGTQKYAEQMRVIQEKMQHHKGPIIVGGDFNAWSRKRVFLLYRFIRKIGLKPVYYKEDLRKRFLGHSLDFIFYRDLSVIESLSIETNASDHNPMWVRFKLKSVL